MADLDTAIVDGGGANIASLQFALERLGATSKLTSDASEIRSARRVILPGVGAAKNAMDRLRERELDSVIPTLTQPVLGICLGMQLLAETSAENDTPCLGVVRGTAGELTATTTSPVPNMGWCELEQRSEHPLLHGIADGSFFYFVHSYALPQTENTLATAVHGKPFTAVLARDNFMGTQFHPERSAAAGARVLANFLSYPQ
ncbi:MAG: imidazole glycerol phosphate synthase subunit HisH [Pseudomonadota bacterium]